MTHTVPVKITSNDIFSATPGEIKLLRKAMGWSTADLAAILGLHVCDNKRSVTVYRWEHGVGRPDVRSRVKMVQIVEKYRVEYLWARKRQATKYFKPPEAWATFLEGDGDGKGRVGITHQVVTEKYSGMAEAVREAERFAAKACRQVRAASRRRSRRARTAGDKR